jgi:hypothetical protein
MDIALVQSVFGIKSNNMVLMPLQNIAIDCIAGLQTICAETIDHPFVAEAVNQQAPEVKGESVSAKRTALMRDYNDTGESTVDFMKENGFVVNQSIYRKADNTYATITELVNNIVKLRMQDGKEGVINISSFIKGEWEQKDMKKKDMKTNQQATMILKWKQWENHAPYSSLAMEICMVQGSIYKVLWNLANEHSEIPQWLRIETKPRNVCTLKGFNTSELKLVPSTLKIDCILDAPDCVPRCAVDLGVVSMGAKTTAQTKFRCLLQPHTFISEDLSDDAPRLVSPAWLVSHTGDDKDVNMAWSLDLSKCNRKSTDQVEVPLLVNTRVLKKGDRLFLKKPPESKVCTVNIEFNTPAKKLRTT